MVTPNLVGSVTMLLAGMGILYLYLKRYEGHFDQARVFFALLVGLFAGALVRFLEQRAFAFENPCIIQYASNVCPGEFTTSTLVFSAAYTAVGYAMLEAAAKTAVLGFKKFRTRPDTPFSGAALGLGFGAMWASVFVSFFLATDATGNLTFEGGALVFDLFVLAMGLGVLLSGAAATVWIGRGAAQGSLWRGLMFGTLWQVPTLLAYWAFINVPGAVVLSVLATLAWGAFAVHRADKSVLQAAIPPEVRDQLRRRLRREMRKA